MKKQLLSFFYIIYSVCAFGQIGVVDANAPYKPDTTAKKTWKDEDGKRHILPYLALSLPGAILGAGTGFYPYGDIGLCYWNSSNLEDGPMGLPTKFIFTPKIGVDFTWPNGKFYMAPKATAEVSISFAGAGLSIIDYPNINGTGSDVRLVPQLGFSFEGTFNIFFEYLAPVSTEQYNWVSTVRMSFIYNLRRWPWQKKPDE